MDFGRVLETVAGFFERTGGRYAVMTSPDSADRLDLDRDLPTTPEDVAVLRRLRYGPKLGFDAYVRALAALGPPATDYLRTRRGPSASPFDLLG